MSVQNLFYWTNKIHDVLYSYGFTETVGNFQEDNFGRGGGEGDGVIVRAQTGAARTSSWRNGAYFTARPDGQNPLIRLLLWDRTSPERDSALDTDVIWHEYGHGLTWRMIDNMDGYYGGAVGEGMSDALGIIHNDDPAYAEYSDNRSKGLRRHRYDAYPLDVTDFIGEDGTRHQDGEIYAATMWKLYKSYQEEGMDRVDLMEDLVEGMNFVAPAPDFIEMRDGILAAASNDRDCLVWDAFAAFGMGVGSSMRPTQSPPANSETPEQPGTPTEPNDGTPKQVRASYGIPSACHVSEAITDLTITTGSTQSGDWYFDVEFLVTDGSGPVADVVVEYYAKDQNTSNVYRSCTTNSAGVCGARHEQYFTVSQSYVDVHGLNYAYPRDHFPSIYQADEDLPVTVYKP